MPGIEIEDANWLVPPLVRDGGSDDRATGTVGRRLGGVPDVCKRPRDIASDSEGGRQAQVDDGYAGQGGDVFSRANSGPVSYSGPVSFDQRTRRSVEEAAV
ncbi:hypothetical protein FDG2_4509 [Candidatus Protofrankia californiensis]|uniref:Uncharacterized protein n=1 Tax=Candidatus Protofrankia californiensis TaxID=1839754 RepID=A0A1C3P6C2_9ACTN|nr:hypothetical protein FDG2_4509 [Candidatus Protofrankia californiensis]